MSNIRKILIVDDDAELRDALLEQLRLHEEFEASAVESATKGMQIAKAGQVDLIIKVMEAMRIPTISMDGYEADDIIASLSSQAEAAGWDVLVVSGDRDAFQLITDKVTVLYPKQGVSDIHIVVGQPPVFRLHGRMRKLETKTLDGEDTVGLMKSITPERCQRELQEAGSADFG